MIDDPQRGVGAYRQWMANIRGLCPETEDGKELPLRDEREAHLLWMTGQLGSRGTSCHHGEIRVLDFGEWNRSDGPDFLRAEMEINGARLRGDVEIDIAAEDWERAGKGEDPAYQDVALHIVLQSPASHWHTRNNLHRDIPVLVLSHAFRQGTADRAPARPVPAPPGIEAMGKMPYAQLIDHLQSAAAYRALQKRQRFQRKAETIGKRQAWYEALAETLGYHANKLPMLLLARRVPLSQLAGKQAESILFGTAGFLSPVLPEKAGEEARLYHRQVWDQWWTASEAYELTGSRRLPWLFSRTRPQNHPHRRVAALAVAATRWREIESHFQVSEAAHLTKALASLRHPYWDTHSCLPSTATTTRMALIGEDRARDFLINHIYVMDPSAQAWGSYLRLKSRHIPPSIRRLAEQLLGNPTPVEDLLPYSFVQQALLQIGADLHL